jgi:hypothetical protein
MLAFPSLDPVPLDEIRTVHQATPTAYLTAPTIVTQKILRLIKGAMTELAANRHSL